MQKICVIQGDGVGPEITDACLRVLGALDLDISFETAEIGIELFKKVGTYLSSETIHLAQESDAILFGTVVTPNDMNFVSPKLLLRWNLDLFANVRPVKCLSPDICNKDLDIVVIRENSEGLFGAVEREVDDKVITERITSEKACRRIIEFVFDYAVKNERRHVSCIHKANILRSSDEMFRSLFYGYAVNYAYTHKIKSDDYLVDDAAMMMAKSQGFFDTLVTLNLYGDILSEEAAGLAGGSAFAPSGNYGPEHAMFLPAQTPMEEMTGKGAVNPTASIMSGAMMLGYLDHPEEEKMVNRALAAILGDRKNWTKDMGGDCSTSEFAERVVKALDDISATK